MTRRTIIAFGLMGLLLSDCAQVATPTLTPMSDLQATETHIAFNIFATQTASVPTATSAPTVTHTQTMTNTPTNTITPTVMNTPTNTATPTITNTLRPTNIPIPSPTPVLQNRTVKLFDQWDVTLISTRRDKTIWGYFGPETAFGTWATVIFRVRNLLTGSSYLGKSFNFQVHADGHLVNYRMFNTSDDKAEWFYSCCQTAWALVHPNEEKVVLITFDVPEDTQWLQFNFTVGNIPVAPNFLVPDFDQILPRPMK